MYEHGNLKNLFNSSLNYWIPILRSEEERKELLDKIEQKGRIQIEEGFESGAPQVSEKCDHIKTIRPISTVLGQKNSSELKERFFESACDLCETQYRFFFGFSFKISSEKAVLFRIENWICLHCYTPFCGRFAKKHMLHHRSSFPQGNISIAVSTGDLGFWCYECDSYLSEKITEIGELYGFLVGLKFGDEN